MIGGLSLTDLRDLYRHLLFDEFIPFWHAHGIDRQGRPPATPTRKDLYHYPRMLMRNLESLERQIRRGGQVADPFAE